MARRFQRFITTFIFAAGLALAGCAVTEAPPQFPPAFGSFPFNGGRTQAVSVNPRNADEVIIATQFGGLWKTTNRGDRWRHLRGLLTVFAADVQYGNDGRTVVATLRNDTQTTNGGGIYVSRDGGDTWARPATGVIPSDAVSDLRGGGWGISVSPDAPRTWYVGTTFGVARSRDNGASWAHVKVETPPPGTGRTNDYAVNSIVALRGGVVLAATDLAVYRSDDEGDSWRRIKSGSFSAYNHWTGFNRLDRDRSGRNAYWAEMSSDSNGRPVYDGLHYYESGPDRWTRIPLPSGGGSRGPFVRVTDLPRSVRAFDFLGISGDWELIWYSQGTRFLATIGESPEDIRNLSAADWIVYGRDDGVHDDMGDLGAAGIAGDVGPPVILGSDGGVFRPAGGIDVWESAAPGGSGMNSLQITDIAGTNVADGGAFRTDLYIATQDNAVWGSSDGGGSFTESDCCEGFHIEAPFAANAGDDVTVAYGTAGSGPGKRMADPGLTERRDVPTAIPGGSISNFAEAFYLGPNRWLRNRWSVVPARGATTCSPGPCSPPEIYTSINDGDLWRKRFTLNLNRLGVIQRTNIHLGSANVSAYLPVGSGAANPDGSEQIGLVRLNNLFAQFAPGAGSSAISTIGTADVVTLPGGGSLGRRATEFDWQAVFGVHPRDARFIIAPDYVNGDVKVTRDGGENWETDRRLTIAASQNGRLQLTGRDSYMQVTHISFDPYDDAKIFVGTRDAGVICSRDGGATWRMIRKTDRIRYVTGFQFRPDGTVWVSSYGRGLWKIKPSRASCRSGEDWIPELIQIPGGLPDPTPRVPGGLTLAALGDDPGAEREPTGADVAGRAVAVLGANAGSAGQTVIGEDGLLFIRARGFDPAGGALTASFNDSDEAAGPLVRPKADGSAEIAVSITADVPFGLNVVKVRQAGEGRIARAEFVRAHLEEGFDEPVGDSPGPDQTLAERLRRTVCSAGRNAQLDPADLGDACKANDPVDLQ